MAIGRKPVGQRNSSLRTDGLWCPMKSWGGLLLNERGEALTVFIREVKKNETYRLRCNKYHAPIVIEFR